MRNIKFRGLTLKKDTLGSRRFWVTGEAHVNCKKPHIHTDMGTMELVDPETITEYTGLQDRNGRDMYEGDIIKYYAFDVREDGEHIWMTQTYIKEVWSEITFNDGAFVMDNSTGFPLMYLTKAYQVKDDFDEEYLNACNLDEFKPVCPTCNDLYLAEVVGNRFENPELLENIEE